jgi:hypothetical protein
MKVLMAALLLCCCFCGSAQTSAPVVSLAGIGEIRVGMKQKELEKLTGQAVKLKNLLKKGDSWNRDTLQLTYKDIPYTVVLDQPRNPDMKDFIVSEVRSSAPALKTRSGVAIGDDRLKIVSTYADYAMHLIPEYENDYTTKSKTRSTVWLFGEGETVIVFYLTEGKITALSVQYYEGC